MFDDLLTLLDDLAEDAAELGLTEPIRTVANEASEDADEIAETILDAIGGWVG